MTEIAYIFWTLVFFASFVAFLIRDMDDDDPRRNPTYQPPRSRTPHRAPPSTDRHPPAGKCERPAGT